MRPILELSLLKILIFFTYDLFYDVDGHLGLETVTKDVVYFQTPIKILSKNA